MWKCIMLLKSSDENKHAYSNIKFITLYLELDFLLYVLLLGLLESKINFLHFSNLFVVEKRV